MKPSLKNKKRYIAYKFYNYSNSQIELSKVIEEIFEKFFGIYGCLETGLKVVNCDEKNNQVILSSFAGKEDRVCFFFSLVNNYRGNPIRLELIGISGTIDALKRKKGIKISKKIKKKL
ncbi:MAG: Rpp14/Pop5 family protein [Candidatus Anstonellaceae archaeon]